jgi:hypothetical protein
MVYHADTFTRKKATHAGMDMPLVHAFYASLGDSHEPIADEPLNEKPVSDTELPADETVPESDYL